MMNKILFCLGSMGRGGAERVIANLSNYFSIDTQVTIVVTKPGKPEYQLNQNIEYVALDKNLEQKNILKRTVKRTLKLRRIFKEKKPDVIISFLPEPSFRAIIAKTFLPTKIIISERADPNREYRKFFKKILAKKLYAKADGLVFQTEDAKNWFPKKIQDKSIIIPNPVNQDFMCKPYTGEREKTIVSVGRLTEQKNHRLLIDAFYDFSKDHKNYTLKIYGEGPLKNNLQKQINQLNLKTKVKLAGEVSNIKNYLYKAKMFVLSSNYEGMPNALMEAMALGLPCISTNCPVGGPKFLIKNNVNGILIKIGDKQELVSALKKISENQSFSDSISKSAHKRMSELNPETINTKWRKYITSLIKKQQTDN